MKKPLHFPAALLIIMLLFPYFGSGQINHQGTPPTLDLNIQNNNFTTINAEAPDVEQLLSEDALADKYGMAMRFAQSVKTNVDLIKQGTWMHLPDGSNLCRLAIHAPGAQATILYYDQFKIPDGGRLFIYDKTQQQVIGGFTNFNNRNGGAFATEMIRGETAILEYHQPRASRLVPEIHIDEVGYVYRTAERIFGERGFGGSDTCEVNVSCPEGNSWQNQAKGVARIMVKQGSNSLWCTGSLVNNTRQDHTPYFLTADHCGPNATATDYDSWIFYFRYQGNDCEDPETDTTFSFYTMVGATKVAAAGGAGVETDFKLLLLNESVPLGYEPFYNGWTRINETSQEGVTIHHPQGDIKKISTYTSPLVSTNWSSVPNTHWRVTWSQTETNWGVTEGGSSGSPIFSSDGLIMGQLTGGDASCSNLTGPDYYGKFSYSWDQIGDSEETQLQPWLDPDNTGTETLGGLVSIEETSVAVESVKIYPNPTPGITYIELAPEYSKKGVYIEILDISGRLIETSEPATANNAILSVDLRDVDQGIYFVRITNHENQVITKKLMR